MTSLSGSSSMTTPKTIALLLGACLVFMLMISRELTAEIEEIEEDIKFVSDLSAVEDDSDMIFPRTSSLEYNYVDSDPDHKYFIYSPSGGFNNQRGELEYALRMGLRFNRTVVIPQAARHTSLWKAYYALNQIDLIPMDQLLDFQKISEYNANVVPLNIPLREFIRNIRVAYNKNRMSIYEISSSELRWYYAKWHEKLMRKAEADPKKFVFFRGYYFQQWWRPSEMSAQVRPYLGYSKYVTDLALSVRKHLGEYSATHIRRGDYSSKASSVRNYMKRLQVDQQVPEGATLYVATEPTSPKSFFKPLCAYYKCIFFSDIQDFEEIKAFNAFFKSPKLRNDVFGSVEQLVCTLGTRFQGSGYSTFTKWIHFAREHRDQIYPNLHLLNDKADLEAKKNEDTILESIDGSENDQVEENAQVELGDDDIKPISEQASDAEVPGDDGVVEQEDTVSVESDNIDSDAAQDEG